MRETLGEALPAAIAKVSELIGKMEETARKHDAMMPGMGDGTRMVARVMRFDRDVAVAAQQSGDVIAMMAAYQKLKPSIELADAEADTDDET